MKTFFGQADAEQADAKQADAEQAESGTISSINKFILFYTMNIY
jgi:hypothetical protein